MYAALARIELFLLEEPHSLKRKRQIIKSLKERIRNRFGASTAEVDELDKWQRSSMGIAFVSGDRSDAEQVLAKIVSYVEADGTVEIVDQFTEYVKL
jgi:uncharacterized protein